MKNLQTPEVDLRAITLNGFSAIEAKTMVDNFNKFNNRKPVMTSIWFSKYMIKNMVDLLKTENNIFPNGVDGVRIYYGRTNDGKNTVILVSTYYGGDDPQTKIKIHQDYFEHDINAPLYKDAADKKYIINGEICNDNSCGGGARLYEVITDYSAGNNCNSYDQHYISMQYAAEMVWNFGKTTINTHCEWFDLKMFSKFLTDRCTGIRVYFGRRSDQDAKYAGLDGFVIVTTEYHKDEEKGIETLRWDYFDCNDKNKPALLDSNDNGEQCHPNCLGTSL